ncbi:hypothetical protein RJ639_047867 [Escallonia herrerae]|uniref:Uncharacterized protein n=1 Tax=Escallonia herrerae TaxID=1293975 RepID=A0AA88W6B0_9ASTE|nr:hypothetical protein RJ639_047867 [Escallonia herrerae]
MDKERASSYPGSSLVLPLFFACDTIFNLHYVCVKFNCHEIGMTLPAASRKLKENSHKGISDKSGGGNINLEDYLPIDPVPSSKASIRPGPIQHGTPLMPYIPKPSPPSPGPSHPKHGGSP